MSTIAKVRQAVKAKRLGSVVTATSLKELGSREAIDQALSRMSREGEILRVARGAYVVPVKGRFGSYAPPAEAVAKSYARAKRTSVTPSGVVAANRFGLTSQQPIRQVYFTSGQSKLLSLGSNPVEFRHVPKWQTILPNHPAGEAVRALAYVGKHGASEAVQTIKARLTPSEWERLVEVTPKLPGWIASAVNGAS